MFCLTYRVAAVNIVACEFGLVSVPSDFNVGSFVNATQFNWTSGSVSSILRGNHAWSSSVFQVIQISKLFAKYKGIRLFSLICTYQALKQSSSLS
jgi:hypothetical protein